MLNLKVMRVNMDISQDITLGLSPTEFEDIVSGEPSDDIYPSLIGTGRDPVIGVWLSHCHPNKFEEIVRTSGFPFVQLDGL